MLKKLLQQIAEEFECDIMESDEFAYYYAKNLVCYTLNHDKKADELFLEFARANGLNEEVPAFVVSFFHEIGHNETIDEVEEEYKGDKNALSFEEYFILEEEWLATEWAIDFCNSHLDLVKKIVKYL